MCIRDRPEVLPMPVDTGVFSRRPEATVLRRIGFTGRFDDPVSYTHLTLPTSDLV